MVKPFPTEILERIIFYYFKRDQLLHTPEDDFTLITPTRGSTSLLLVSRAFRLLVLPSLFYSISITQPHHWDLLLRWEQGLLDGFSDEARTRRSWVREIRLDLNVNVPIALEPDGLSLSPDVSQASRDLGFIPFKEDDVSPALVSISLSEPVVQGTPSPPPFFPDVDRVVLLPSHTDSPPPWSPQLLHQLEQRHLELYRKEKNDPSAAFPGGQLRLAAIVREGLRAERNFEIDDLVEESHPRNVWIPVGGGRGGGGIDKAAVLLSKQSCWTEQVIKRFVLLPPPPPPSPSLSPILSNISLADNSNKTLFAPLNLLFHALSSFHDLELMASNVRFVAFPLKPPGRRRFWDRLFDEISLRGGLEAMLEDEESEYEKVMLKVVKEKNWAWVDDDGREIGFEEGMTLVEAEE